MTGLVNALSARTHIQASPKRATGLLNIDMTLVHHLLALHSEFSRTSRTTDVSTACEAPVLPDQPIILSTCIEGVLKRLSMIFSTIRMIFQSASVCPVNMLHKHVQLPLNERDRFLTL